MQFRFPVGQTIGYHCRCGLVFELRLVPESVLTNGICKDPPEESLAGYCPICGSKRIYLESNTEPETPARILECLRTGYGFDQLVGPFSEEEIRAALKGLLPPPSGDFDSDLRALEVSIKKQREQERETTNAS